MRYSVITFGCRVNQADSLDFEEKFRASGAMATEPERADIVVVNTCSVTASADQAARQTVRRIARANPAADIVVTGCYATRRPDEVAALAHVSRTVANDDKRRLVPLILTSSKSDSGSQVVRSVRLPTSPDLTGDLSTAERFGDGDGSCGAAIEPGVMGRTAFTLRVQTGCAEPCAYCIIPTTRGRPRSVPIGEICADVDRVIAAGFKEIVLTGVHLGSYGRDLSPRSSLVGLLHALAVVAVRNVRIEPGLLFRISSLEPMDCTAEIVELVATSGRFAPHFHLPLQHASSRILRAMRRPYTCEQYAALVGRIRTRMPNAAIGSDVIVGFPGETDDDFEELAGYLARSPLTYIHVFPYSDRPGTAASAVADKVHGAVIRTRARRVRDIGRQLSTRFRESQVGTVHPGLTLEDGSLVVTGNYLKVRIAPGRARNGWVRVRITEAGETVRGEIL